MDLCAAVVLLLYPFGQPWYPLPAEKTCAAMWNVAQADEKYIRDVANGCTPVLTGWHFDQCVALKADAELIRGAYWAAWWVTWPKATDEQREHWAGILIDIVGYDDYAAGRLPVPLSMRGP